MANHPRVFIGEDRYAFSHSDPLNAEQDRTDSLCFEASTMMFKIVLWKGLLRPGGKSLVVISARWDGEGGVPGQQQGEDLDLTDPGEGG